MEFESKIFDIENIFEITNFYELGIYQKYVMIKMLCELTAVI